MATLDEVCRTVWDVKQPPLGLLAATCLARAAGSDLSPEDRAPFAALTAAILAWCGDRKRLPQSIYDEEFAACLGAWNREPKPTHLKVALDGAYLEMSALLRIAPRSLPGDGFYDVGIEHFLELTKGAAKRRRTTGTRIKAQLEHLLGLPRDWPTLRDAAARMPFDGPPGDGPPLSPQLDELVRFLDLGASWSWSTMGPKQALRLELGSTKRTAMLDAEAHAALLRAAPWLAPAA